MKKDMVFITLLTIVLSASIMGLFILEYRIVYSNLTNIYQSIQ